MKDNTTTKIFGREIDVLKSNVIRAAVEFAVIALILLAVAWLVHCHVMHLLDEAMETSMRRHISTLTHSIDRQLEQELNEMHMGASLVERNQVDAVGMLDVSRLDNAIRLTGIVDSDGGTLAGTPLPEGSVALIDDVFNGNNVTTYKKSLGLLFATPIRINERNYAFYTLYDNDAIRENFSVVSYDGEGRVTLAYKTREWTAISLGTDNGKYYDELYSTPGFIETYEAAIAGETITEGRVVKKFEFGGEDYLIFSSVLENSDFAIFGIVKREVVMVGIEYIHAVILGVICLLLIILVGAARYLIKSVENKELQREKQLADRSSKMKSEFLSNVSHELRTPLNAILGMDEMVLREAKSSTMLEYAENIRSAGKNLLGLVNDILDFSKIEAGKMEIIPVDYQLSSLLNDLVNMIHTRAEKKGLQFIPNASHDLPTMLHGDEIRIKQVVTNILTNAVKYTEAGSVTLTVDFEKLADDKILLRFSIKDTGIGIKPEDLPKLFNAFERIEEKRNRTIEGTGLGMNITQQLLRLMNSKLEVESVYGKGSTFSFALEQRVISWEPLGNFEEAFRNSLKHHEKYHEKFTAPNAKILVVDDTVMNLTVVKGLLKQTKIQIVTAESGYECLELAAKEKFDIIFLDHRMPGLDGIETLQEMKKLNPSPNAETPVIALTANAISGAREKYLDAGFRGYVSKPIDPTTLETLIAKLLPSEKIEEASNEASADSIDDAGELPEWLQSINEIDSREGVKHCGSAEDYLAALKVFAEAIERNSDEIEKLFRAEDWKNYTTKVHALKSTARVIGAMELSERARRLEDAGNSGRIEAIVEETEPLLEVYRSFAGKLSPLIKSADDDGDKPPISDDELSEAIETLREVSASFDYDSVMFVLESLDEYRLPDEEAARIKAIKAAVAQLDWDKVNSLLNAA